MSFYEGFLKWQSELANFFFLGEILIEMPDNTKSDTSLISIQLNGYVGEKIALKFGAYISRNEKKLLCSLSSV